MTDLYDYIGEQFSNMTPREQAALAEESETAMMLIRTAHMLRKLAKSMLADANGDSAHLIAHCKALLDHEPKFGLTPTVMAERMTRIAALPKAHTVNAEGRVYMARIDNPLGDGSVWCALDMSETFRKTLEVGKQERAL
jgi:hypothetical protein